MSRITELRFSDYLEGIATQVLKEQQWTAEGVSEACIKIATGVEKMEKSETIKFTVKRSNWFRGEGSERSRLLRGDGKMCCLGFLALSCGFTEEEILQKPTPMQIQLISARSSIEFPLIGYSRLMRINDAEGHSEGLREELLKKEFEFHSVEVEFVD